MGAPAEKSSSSAGDAGVDALEAVYRANFRDVYSFAASRVGVDDAADVTAEVFHAAAVAHADGAHGHGHPGLALLGGQEPR